MKQKNKEETRQTKTQLAQILGGEVGQLPKGETKPDSADILVILGKINLSRGGGIRTPRSRFGGDPFSH